VAVVNALADALSLDAAERLHVRYLAKITGGACVTHPRPAPAPREVRASVLGTLRLLEPGIAAVTNRLGDILAHTSGFAAVFAASGLLDGDQPNLTRYVFTDERARTFFADWSDVADEQAFDLWHAPSLENSEWLRADLAIVAGPDFTRRLNSHVVPSRGALRLNHPAEPRVTLTRETLDVATDEQQLIVFLPAEDETTAAVERLKGEPHARLRSIS
jgi:hypothetical protein